MALQPNGHGLNEGAADPWNLPPSQRTQQNEPAGIAGRPSAAKFDVTPQQSPIFRSGTIDAFVKTCQRWHLSPAQQIILLGYKCSEFFGLLILDGLILSPPQDVRDRVGYVLAISVGLGFMFDDSERAELGWLQTPRQAFNENSPLAHMLKGRMENLMEVAAWQPIRHDTIRRGKRRWHGVRDRQDPARLRQHADDPGQLQWSQRI
jgi:hypothetical protein